MHEDESQTTSEQRRSKRVNRRTFVGASAVLAMSGCTGLSGPSSTVWGMIRGVPSGTVEIDGNTGDIAPSGYYQVAASDGEHTLTVRDGTDADVHSTTVTVDGDTRYDETIDRIRGTWRRPPTDLETMKADIDEYVGYGVTDLFLETFFHGSTIYPSSHTVRKEGYGKSYLSDVIEYAHEKGLRIHAWCEAMYWWHCRYLGQPPEGHPLHGDDTFTSEYGGTYQLDGDRMTVTRNGTWESEGGKNFASPFCEKNVTFLTDIVTEIESNYEFDGVQLDYIRFPKHDPAFGYGPCSPATEGTTEAELHPKRERAVSDVVKRVTETLDEETIASVAVFPRYYVNPGPAEYHKSQDWKHWGKEYGVDWDVPMCYAYDEYGAQLHKSRELQTFDESVLPALAITEGHDDIVTQYETYDTEEFAGYNVWKAESIDKTLP